MKIISAFSTDPDSKLAMTKSFSDLRIKLEDQIPQLIIVHSSVTHNCEALMKTLKNLAPNIPVLGGKSLLSAVSSGQCYT